MSKDPIAAGIRSPLCALALGRGVLGDGGGGGGGVGIALHGCAPSCALWRCPYVLVSGPCWPGWLVSGPWGPGRRRRAACPADEKIIAWPV